MYQVPFFSYPLRQPEGFCRNPSFYGRIFTNKTDFHPPPFPFITLTVPFMETLNLSSFKHHDTRSNSSSFLSASRLSNATLVIILCLSLVIAMLVNFDKS